ncbi:MAG: glycerophosphodiester phosphodiesterase family protein [Bacteroidota bacterium]
MTKKFLIYSTPIMVLFTALALFEPWIYQNIVASTSLERLKNKEFEVIAHKGASGVAPENTLEAFQKAIDLGVDMIELDVRHTKDSAIIVFHDQMLDRTTNGTGDVHDYTLAEIKALDAGSWFGDTTYANAKVPTLKEALDLINGQCKVLIEVKHMDHPLFHDFAMKLVDVIREEKDGFEWCILQSYENLYLEEAKAYDPRVQTKKLLVGEDSAPLLAFYIETRVHLGRGEQEGKLAALNPHYETLSPRRIFRMHSRGFKVYTYPVNERDDMIKMLNMGVDGIITDYPSRLIQIREDIKAL